MPIPVTLILLLFGVLSCFFVALIVGFSAIFWVGYYLPNLRQVDFSAKTFVTEFVSLVLLYSLVPTLDYDNASLALASFRWFLLFPSEGF